MFQYYPDPYNLSRLKEWRVNQDFTDGNRREFERLDRYERSALGRRRGAIFARDASRAGVGDGRRSQPEW